MLSATGRTRLSVRSFCPHLWNAETWEQSEFLLKLSHHDIFRRLKLRQKGSVQHVQGVRFQFPVFHIHNYNSCQERTTLISYNSSLGVGMKCNRNRCLHRTSIGLSSNPDYEDAIRYGLFTSTCLGSKLAASLLAPLCLHSFRQFGPTEVTITYS